MPLFIPPALYALATGLITRVGVKKLFEKGGAPAVKKVIASLKSKKQSEMFTPKTGKVKKSVGGSDKVARAKAVRDAANKKAKNKTPTGNKPRVKGRSPVKETPAPKQLEMFTKAGKVRASVKKSNAKPIKAAPKKTALRNTALTTAGVGIGVGIGKGAESLAKQKPTVKSKKAVDTTPRQTAKEAKLTAKQKFLAKRAAKKKGTARGRTLKNENKRLKNRTYG